jgi:hypothetical protein
MSVPSLTDRLDNLSSANKDEAKVIPTDLQSSVEVIQMVDSTPEFEPTQVAGLGLSMIRETLKKAPKQTERLLIQEGSAVEKAGPFQVIREASEDTANVIIEGAPSMPTTGKPSPSSAQKAAGVQETTFNLDMIKDEDGVKQYIEAISRQVGADKIEKISYKEVAAKAAAEGYDEAFLARIIDPTVATEANMASAYKMLLAVTDAGKRAFDLGQQVTNAQENGTLTAELASAFQQAVALEGVLVKQARNRQADIARTLGIFSQARQSTAERGAMLEAMMSEAGGIKSVHDFANKYIALTTNSARANLAEAGYANDFLGVASRFKDMWFSTWINGLLSALPTHAKNIVGNTLFGVLSIPERAVASVIGKTRNMMFKGGEKAISFDEVYAHGMSLMQGIREGFIISSKAFKENTPTDTYQKIEQARFRRDPFDWDMGDSEFGKSMSLALRYWGKIVTVPGRALMAEDEFFKAIAYRMELSALSVRETEKVFASAIEGGVDVDKATQNAADYLFNTMVNPPREIDEAAKSMARIRTFTNDLEPVLQGVQKTLQNPLLKVFVPFFKSPANITLEGLARTPLFFTSPRFYADWNAGGIRRDMAMAKITLGSATVYSLQGYVFDGRLTGYGPMNKKDRDALLGTGWLPFAFSFKNEDVSDELLAKFNKLTIAKRSPDLTYITYAGIEPFATMLGISATIAEYAQMNPDADSMEKLTMGGAWATYTYVSEQPALQGLGDIHRMFASRSSESPDILYDMVSNVSKQASDFVIGGSPAGAYSSLIASVERVLDPTKSNTMPSDISTKSNNLTDPAVRAFWESVKRYKSRNPLTSDSLLPALDPITGEVQSVGKGNLYEFYSPVRTSSGNYIHSKAILDAYGAGQYTPPKTMDGVKLSDELYNRWITLATNRGQLAKDIEVTANLPFFKKKAANDLKGAQDYLSKIVSDAYSDAKKILIKESPDLRQAIEKIKQEERRPGSTGM